jgi:hypothetical protein
MGFTLLNTTKWFGIFLILLRISRNFLRLWTDLQENLDRFLCNQALTFTRNTLQRFKSLQLGPWPGRAARARPALASRWRCRPGKRPGATRSSPRGCRMPELGRRDGQRRVSVAAGGGGRGGSVKDGVEMKCWQTSDLGRFAGA